METDASSSKAVDEGLTMARLKAMFFQGRSLSRLAPASVISMVAFCVFTISIVAAQSTTKTVRHHKVEEQDPIAAKIYEAEQDIDKQDYAAAEALLKQAVAEAPENYSVWYDLGFVYHAMGRRDDSIAAYRKSVAAKPDVFESNLNLGLALADAGQPDAEQSLRAATGLTPVSNPAAGKKRAWVGLGHLLEAGKPDEAASAYQQASLADPKDPEPHLLAATLLEKNHPADAEKEYQQALALAPESPDALAALTNFYMRQRRFADAEALLRKLVAVHPNDATAHLQLGRMLAISGKTGDGIGELESGLKLDPSDSQAQHDLADLYLETSKFSQAEELYRRLTVSHPNDPAFHHGLGKALLHEKKYAEAERELARAVQLRPDFGPAYGDLAVAAAENKDYEFAIKAVDMRAKFLPEIPITYFLRATAYDNLHDVKAAARYYHQFLDVAGGKFPDQEWQARHRLIAIEPKK
jgi:tetratricopeptide (TPR) repeat protein